MTDHEGLDELGDEQIAAVRLAEAGRFYEVYRTWFDERDERWKRKIEALIVADLRDLVGDVDPGIGWIDKHEEGTFGRLFWNAVHRNYEEARRR